MLGKHSGHILPHLFSLEGWSSYTCRLADCAALVLGAEAAASRDFLDLLLAVPEEPYFGSNRAAAADCSRGAGAVDSVADHL